MARFLLENGAQLNARNDAGETPLHFACRAGKVNLKFCIFLIHDLKTDFDLLMK